MSIDYENENEKLTDSEHDFLKLEKGLNKILIAGAPEIVTEEKDWDDSPQDYVHIPVEVVEYNEDENEHEKVEKTWEVKRSLNESSKWGQLVQYGFKKHGLEGEKIDWYVQGEGKDRRHTLMNLAETDEEPEPEPEPENDPEEELL